MTDKYEYWKHLIFKHTYPKV